MSTDDSPATGDQPVAPAAVSGDGTPPAKKARWTKEAKAAAKARGARKTGAEADKTPEKAEEPEKKTRAAKAAAAPEADAAAAPAKTRRKTAAKPAAAAKTARPRKAKAAEEAAAPAPAPRAAGRKATKAETARTDTPKTETPKAEAPGEEAPKAPAPQTAAPQAPATRAETPKESPKAEAPRTPAPQADAPRAETPQTSAPQPVTPPAPAQPAQPAPVSHSSQPSPVSPAPQAGAPAVPGADTPGRKKRRRRRHKNRSGDGAGNGQPQSGQPGGQPAAPQPARPVPLNLQGPASYGAVIAAASQQNQTGAAPVNSGSAPAADSNSSGVPGTPGEPGSGRRKRRRRRRKKHGGGDVALSGGLPQGAMSPNPAPQGAADTADAAAAGSPALGAPAPADTAAPASPESRPAPAAPAEAPQVREKATTQNAPRTATGRKLLINVVDAGQARVAIVGRDGLEELHIEKDGGRFVHGNIFKGRVDGVQPNLQAAFINIGGEKNAFLHVGDVVPPFGGYEDILGRRRKKAPSDTKDMRIEDMLVEGQEVLVQITREALVTKGPSVTTYLSIPGRYLVAMPCSTTRGVSKKITDDGERRELKKALEKLSPPKDMGYIIRTAGMGKGTEELQLDLDALNRMWQSIGEQARKAKSPAVLYQENDLVIRTIRDNFRDDIDELVIDSPADHARAMDFVNLMMPDFAGRVKLYDKKTPMFHAYGIEDKISNLFNRSVKLKSGGEILLEQTEAMVTIDVNTGKMGKVESTREMILQANLEAAEAIAREIRLRDLGGLVMIDFIDMDTAEDRRAVEQALRRATRHDPSRITILPISQLGVLEMTRQRLRQSLHHTHYRTCPYCAGQGMYKRPESLGIEFLRRLRTEFEKKNVQRIKATFNPHTAFDMANSFRSQLTAIENEYGKKVVLAGDESFPLDKYVFAVDND